MGKIKRILNFLLVLFLYLFYNWETFNHLVYHLTLMLVVQARRAFQALRSLVKLQALARGVCARRQARIALQFMHALVRLQVRVRARQLLNRYSEESDSWRERYHIILADASTRNIIILSICLPILLFLLPLIVVWWYLDFSFSFIFISQVLCSCS